MGGLYPCIRMRYTGTGNNQIAGVYAPPEVERTPEMQKAPALSTELNAELQAAYVHFISTPMYNFTIPVVLKS